MTESQIKEQEIKRTSTLTVDDILYSNKSNASFNEIQNTLDDTIEINDSESSVSIYF